jgi:hypothetical protein
MSQAGPQDLEDLVDVYLTALQDNVAWDHAYPYRNEYPGEHRYQVRVALMHFLSDAQSDFIVMMVEHASYEHPYANRIIAFAV